MERRIIEPVDFIEILRRGYIQAWFVRYRGVTDQSAYGTDFSSVTAGTIIWAIEV